MLAAIAGFVVAGVMVVSLGLFGPARSQVLALVLPFAMVSLTVPGKQRTLLFLMIALLPTLALPLPPRRYGLSLSDLLIYLLVAMTALQIMLGQAPPLLRGRTIFTIPLILLGLAAVLTSMLSDDSPLAGLEVIDNVKYVLFYILFIRFVQTKGDLRLVVMLVVAAFAPSVLLGMVQYFLHKGLDLGAVDTTAMSNTSFHSEGVDLVRAFGPFGESLAFGQYLMLPLGLVGALAAYEKRRPWIAIWLGLLGMGTIALVCTLSRGSWVSFALAAAVVVWLWIPKKTIPYLLLWPLTAAIAVVGYWSLVRTMIPPGIAARIEGAQHDFDNGRHYTWLAGLDIFRDHPIFGIGLRNLFHVLPLYHPSAVTDVFYSQTFSESGVESFGAGHMHVDNFYLTLLTEVGIVGIVPFVWLVIVAVLQAFRNFHNAPPDLKPYALGVLGGLLGTFGCMATAYTYADDRLALLIWMMLGMTIVLKRLNADDGTAG
jgi:O-antigen ligase